MSLRLARALLWLKWRSLVNLLRFSRRRGAGAAISAWGGAVVRVVLVGVALVMAAAFAVGALFAVWALAGGAGAEGRAATLVALRVGLGLLTFAVVLFAVIGASPGGGTGTTRLLLLPVSLRHLHALELAAALADPALLVALPALLVLGLGTAVVRPAGAAPALLAVGLLVATLVALVTVVAFAVQILLRDRRRSELAVVFLIVAWVAVSVLPAALHLGHRRDRGDVPAAAPAESAGPEVSEPPAEAPRGAEDLRQERLESAAKTFPTLLEAVPSEAFVRALAGATATGGDDRGGTWWGAPVLALELLALYGLSLALWRRLLAGPGSASGRRGAAAAPLPGLRFPGLTAPAAAVAWVLVRGTWRTVLGKLALVMPALSVAASTLVLQPPGGGRFAFPPPWGAVALAVVAITLTVLSQHSILFNQFAVDGAGLTLELAAPLSDRDLVQGKAAGGAVLTAVALLPALLVVAVLQRAPSPLFWPAALLAGLGMYALLSPLAAGLSIVLPKAVDLSRIGQAGKPHGGAALIGFAALPLALAPPVGLGAVALLHWQSPILLLAVEALWSVVAAAVAWPFLRAAEGLLARRREAILLTVRERE